MKIRNKMDKIKNKEEKMSEETMSNEGIKNDEKTSSIEGENEVLTDDIKEEQETSKAEPDVSESESEKIQALSDKLAEIQDKYMRTYAEYENYRKRTNAEKADLLLNGSKDMAKAILPIIDDMERALAAMPDDNDSKEGVNLIYGKLLSILQQKGVRQMNTIGETFSSETHEAVTQVPAADDSQKNKVIDEVQKGYYMNDKVLRYAKVVVAI